MRRVELGIGSTLGSPTHSVPAWVPDSQRIAGKDLLSGHPLRILHLCGIVAADTCKADYGRVQARMPSVEALLTQVFTSAVPEWRTAVAEAKAKALSDASGPAAVGGVDLVACES